MLNKILLFSVNSPKKIFWLTGIAVLVSILMMFNFKVDTDPENMLPQDHPARVLHHQVKDAFGLSDMLVVGMMNDKNPNGIYNPQSLANLEKLSNAISQLDGVVVEDLMSLPVSDNITQVVKDNNKAISFHYLMSPSPKTQAQADQIKKWVKRLPMLDNTLVSGDGKVAALFIPIHSKDQSYALYNEINQIISRLKDSSDQFYITGLPVAEDTFGVEMFIQMAISAPAAAGLIFVLMLFFFRSIPLVIAPMIVAMATVIITMGLLIGCGFSVHIMSSMIPIFLMPIAMVDAIHMLSDFSDSYRSGMDKKQLVTEGIQRLFRPILFTSITTIVGFLSLNTADIPPVRIFGSFVGIGVFIAFLLTITFIPAYVVSLSDKTFAKMAARAHANSDNDATSFLARLLRKMPGKIEYYRYSILVVTTFLIGISSYGITQIVINDNPINWFEKDHPIRKADIVMNSHFAGTYEAYLSFSEKENQKQNIVAKADQLLVNAPKNVKEQWQNLVKANTHKGILNTFSLSNEVLDLQFNGNEQDEPYWTRLGDFLEQHLAADKFFLKPENLAYIEKVEKALMDSGLVGKTNGLPEVLKTVNRELLSGQAKDYRLPANERQAAQGIMTFQSSHHPNYIWHMLTPDYKSTVIWIQLKSGDNQDMSKVLDYMDHWFQENPMPSNMSKNWSGLTYINVIWQEAMVNGMLASLVSSFVIVALMMIFLFRSVIWGIVAMIPLSVTILFIYGLIGLTGKNYDMPVAVLSALTLGMSVDFAIHFIERSGVTNKNGNWREGLKNVFEEPGRAIVRNAIVIALGFTPLFLAPLIPYQTVGFFMAAIMAISCFATLVIIPALIYALNKWLFKKTETI